MTSIEKEKLFHDFYLCPIFDSHYFYMVMSLCECVQQKEYRDSKIITIQKYKHPDINKIYDIH